MTNIEILLKQISKIVVKEKIHQEEKRKRGEIFNIFDVLGLSTNEVRLHSAFLAELLDPDGNHGLGDKFLIAFVESIIKRVEPVFEIDTRSCKVHVEYPIGEISEDYSEGGRIDLLIQDKNNQTIIIENKIYAGDQHKQLLRYDNYAKKKYKAEQYVLLYLTPEKRDASEDSTGNEDLNYYRICYKEDILNWLEHCVGIAALFPRVRETLTQYITNLKQIMSIMSEMNKQTIVELLINKSNIDATLEIISMSEDVGNTIRTRFIENNLTELAKNHGMTLSYDKEFVVLGTHSRNYKNIRFVLPGYDKCYFQIENEGNSVYYGIVAVGYPENQRVVMEQFEDWSDGVNPKWPYGSNYFPGNLKWWDGFDSLTDMVKGNRIVEIIDNELTKIRKNRLIEKYAEIMDGIDNMK